MFAMSNLRSELADESSITITEENMVALYPLIVLGDGLVQIVMPKSRWVDSQSLWVPEGARSNWHLMKHSNEVAPM